MSRRLDINCGHGTLSAERTEYGDVRLTVKERTPSTKAVPILLEGDAIDQLAMDLHDLARRAKRPGAAGTGTEVEDVYDQFSACPRLVDGTIWLSVADHTFGTRFVVKLTPGEAARLAGFLDPEWGDAA